MPIVPAIQANRRREPVSCWNSGDRSMASQSGDCVPLAVVSTATSPVAPGALTRSRGCTTGDMNEIGRRLLATCWTHAGDARPGRGDGASPLTVRERIEATAAAGWDGIGLPVVDLERARA